MKDFWHTLSLCCVQETTELGSFLHLSAPLAYLAAMSHYKVCIALDWFSVKASDKAWPMLQFCPCLLLAAMANERYSPHLKVAVPFSPRSNRTQNALMSVQYRAHDHVISNARKFCVTNRHCLAWQQHARQKIARLEARQSAATTACPTIENACPHSSVLQMRLHILRADASTEHWRAFASNPTNPP